MVKVLKFDAERVFDVARHRMDSETRGTPYTKFKAPLNSEQQDRFIGKAIQAFMHGLADVNEGGHISIQAFGGSSDLPEITKDVFDVTAKTTEYDLGWQDAFKGIKLQKGQLSWEIDDVSQSISFEEILEGGKIKYGEYSGDKVYGYIKKYGAGLAVTWELMEGRKLYAFVDRLEITRSKLYAKWASVHYGLLNTAAASHAISWQGAAADSQIDRDIMTLNYAGYTQANLNRNKGYGDMANARMLLYISPKYRARINAALKVGQSDIVRSGGKGVTLDWPIEPRFTFDSAITADKGLLVLPGNKIQNSVYLRELGLSRQDQESLSELRTYWTAFGATVADTEQCSQISWA